MRNVIAGISEESFLIIKNFRAWLHFVGSNLTLPEQFVSAREQFLSHYQELPKVYQYALRVHVATTSSEGYDNPLSVFDMVTRNEAISLQHMLFLETQLGHIVSDQEGVRNKLREKVGEAIYCDYKLQPDESGDYYTIYYEDIYDIDPRSLFVTVQGTFISSDEIGDCLKAIGGNGQFSHDDMFRIVRKFPNLIENCIASLCSVNPYMAEVNRIPGRFLEYMQIFVNLSGQYNTGINSGPGIIQNTIRIRMIRFFMQIFFTSIPLEVQKIFIKARKTSLSRVFRDGICFKATTGEFAADLSVMKLIQSCRGSGQDAIALWQYPLHEKIQKQFFYDCSQLFIILRETAWAREVIFSVGIETVNPKWLSDMILPLWGKMSPIIEKAENLTWELYQTISRFINP